MYESELYGSKQGTSTDVYATCDKIIRRMCSEAINSDAEENFWWASVSSVSIIEKEMNRYLRL